MATSCEYDRQLAIINANREYVQKSYDTAEADNYRRFLKGDVKATDKYIYPNQKLPCYSLIYYKLCRAAEEGHQN